MGQQFVEVTSLRYGGRSVISKRSLNGCSPGYKLSMASEGSRTALKHAATKQTCRLRSTGRPFQRSLPPFPPQIMILSIRLSTCSFHTQTSTVLRVSSTCLIRSVSSLLFFLAKRREPSQQPGRLLRQRFPFSTRFFRQSALWSRVDSSSRKPKDGSCPLLAGSYYAWGEFQRP